MGQHTKLHFLARNHAVADCHNLAIFSGSVFYWQKGLGSIPLQLSLLFNTCGLWVLSCDFVPHN